MPATPSNQYALGRNSLFRVTYAGLSKNICVSEGSIDLSANTIEITNNCNNGWVIKLPGLRSGTISITGYLATETGEGPLTWLGEIVSFMCEAYDSQNVQGLPLYFEGMASCTGARVSIDANDACRVEMTFELTGAPSDSSFTQLAGY